MTVKVKRGNDVMAVRDNNQLAAFLNSGWEVALENEPKAEEAEPVKTQADEPVETKQTPKKPATRKRTTTRKAR